MDWICREIDRLFAADQPTGPNRPSDRHEPELLTGCQECVPHRNKPGGSTCKSEEPGAGGHAASRSGRVLCPILRSHVCELCQGTGDTAHTRSYCPLVTGGRGRPRLSATVQLKSTRHNAAGRRRF
ncbi:nanos homolog 2-like [Pollicipes pollicipes]|uniref:nanos homolog 2-like n=1 Tax=Pollicipes pollicipes TaxID=41117 RepID=UPI001884E080|nr:nanos homolog 2-like [Pollicipes pollicipes]